MAPLDRSIQQELAARLRFYRDLGLTDFYRRPVDPAILEALTEQHDSVEPSFNQPQKVGAPSNPQPLANWVGNHEPHPSLAPPQTPGAPGLASETQDSTNRVAPGAPGLASETWDSTNPVAHQRQSAPTQVDSLLQQIREEIGDCTRCALHTGRNTIVFGDGSPNARLFFVGEGPGADEDAQGIPFVGKAGQLLNNMITAMGLKREEVYIANVVKCRPPGNRTPEPDEANTCSPFLFQQIEVVQPEVIVALGATAATYLLGQRQPLAGLRGRVHSWRGSKLIVTYHPAFLLRDPRMKKDAWADLQIAMRELGLKPKGKE